MVSIFRGLFIIRMIDLIINNNRLLYHMYWTATFLIGQTNKTKQRLQQLFGGHYC